MRIAAVGDVHGGENLPTLLSDLERLEPPDLFLLAGDLTDHNDLDAFIEVVDAVRGQVRCPIYGVFGNNEDTDSPPEHRKRSGNPPLDDQLASVPGGGRDGRVD